MSVMNRKMRRAHPPKPGYGTARGGCPHVLARFAPKHEQTSTLVRYTYPCVEPPGHDQPHRTGGGKEWT